MSTHNTTRPPAILRRQLAISIVIGTLITLTLGSISQAEHEGTNMLTFAAVDGSPSPNATGSGQILYRGGAEPESRWTSTFDFAGLEPDTPYTVTVMGRTGDDGSAAAQAFSSICSFRGDAAGTGHCWDYELGMQRLGVVQLRRDDETGVVVLQATRAVDGIGSIESNPNRFSPATLTPFASTPPAGSPAAG